MLKDREDIRRQIDLMQPKLQALMAKLDSLDRAKDVFEDYFGAQDTPESSQAKPKVDRRRRRPNGQAKPSGEPKKVSATSAAALGVVRESPMGVTVSDILEVLNERGIAARPGPLTRSLNFHASYNKIYQGDDGRWHAAASQEMPAAE